MITYVLQTFSFLLLPGEIRNMIYRNLLGPKFDHDKIISISLFKTQPAITRVNKQIRVESLSIYYAENRFWMVVFLQNDYSAYLDTDDIDYVDFCHSMKKFAPAQAQSYGIQNSLRLICDLEAIFYLESNTTFAFTAKFEKKSDRDTRSQPDWWGLTGGRLGGDKTDWADRTTVDALVKQWMEALPDDCGSPSDDQERLIHVLWLLGVNLTSDSTTLVSIDY